MDIFDELDINLSSLFEYIENEGADSEEIESESTLNNEEKNGENEYLDDEFSSYDFVNNNGEVETFWTCDPETCSISFDIAKAEIIKNNLLGKRKYRTQRKMDDKEIIPSREEVRNQDFFPRYDDVDSVEEFSFTSKDK